MTRIVKYVDRDLRSDIQGSPMGQIWKSRDDIGSSALTDIVSSALAKIHGLPMNDKHRVSRACVVCTHQVCGAASQLPDADCCAILSLRYLSL